MGDTADEGNGKMDTVETRKFSTMKGGTMDSRLDLPESGMLDVYAVFLHPDPHCRGQRIVTKDIQPNESSSSCLLYIIRFLCFILTLTEQTIPRRGTKSLTHMENLNDVNILVWNTRCGIS